MRLSVTTTLIALAALTLAPLPCPQARAQAPCDATCDRIVEPSVHRVDGAGLSPGDTVCLRGGTAPNLTIDGVHGTLAAPITIRACDTPLVLGGGTATQGMGIVHSSNLRVTGGDGRSIQVVGGASYSVGVSVGACTEHLEVDGLEVSGTSYTAYRNLSEDATCSVRTGFSLHHWFIHDVGGEGMFFGANLSSTPFRLVNVEVYANRIERTGMQGIKIGTSVDDAHVHGNVVIDVGTRDIGGEDTGITGSARSFFIEGNVVVRTRASCMFVSGPDLHIVNNVLWGCGDAAVSINGDAARVRILHNTLVDLAGNALNMWAAGTMDSAFANNLVLDAPRGLGITSSANWTVEGNLTSSASEAGFARPLPEVGTVTFDALSPSAFALLMASPSVDAASPAFADEVSTDIAGTTRDGEPDIGAHEFVRPLPDAGPPSLPDAGAGGDGGTGTDGGARSDASANDAGVASSAGCSVSPSQASGWSGSWLALPLALLAVRTRHRRLPSDTSRRPTGRL